MNTRKYFIEILGKYSWIFLIFVVGGYFFTDIPFFKYTGYTVGILISLVIFMPILYMIFSPGFILVASLIAHFRGAKEMSFGKKYIFMPFTIVSIASFYVAQIVLFLSLLVISIAIWTSVIGFFWTFFLTFAFGLAPLTIITALFLSWYTGGLSFFLGFCYLFLTTVFWLGLRKLAFPDDNSVTPDDFLGYSPKIFLLGAISFQVIALPFYVFELINIGNIISDFVSWAFLDLTLIAFFIWRSKRKKLSDDALENFYKPPVWIYILGLFIVNLIAELNRKFEVTPTVIFWLLVFFVAALISRLFRFIWYKLKKSNKHA